jgi:beta-N-acetylhexosaminidase
MKNKHFIALLLLFIPVFAHAQLSLEQKIGQLIMVGFNNTGDSYDTLKVDLEQLNLGSVILYGHNLENPTQMKNLTTELNTFAKSKLFIATDQEGGYVSRLNAGNGFQSTYSAAQLGSFNSEETTRGAANLMAGWMNQVGINVNLAPVADVNVNPKSPAIGKLNRSFSSDPAIVSKHVNWYADEFHQANIATALKHFPGHGSAVSDSHLGFTDISTTWKTYELDPFRNVIESGYSDMIMTGHLFKEDWDSTYPVSLSKHAITTILRDSLHFNGVVISDEFFMKAISNNFGLDEAIVESINAGTDILLFYGNLYEGNSITRHVINLIMSKIESGEIDEQLISDAFERVQKLKNIRLSTVSIAENYSEIPNELSLFAYPNPFNPTTTIQALIPRDGNYKIDVFSMLGQKVATLHNSYLSSGNHSFNFDGNKLSSGMYLVVINSGSQRTTMKITLAK